MLICGVKITHDSAIAVLDENRLLFSIELEKINNNNRFKIIDDLSWIEDILKSEGIELNEIDQFVVDGWVSLHPTIIERKNRGESSRITLAPYHESSTYECVLEGIKLNGLKIGHKDIEYKTYMHTSGHIFSSYCTSPFASKLEDSFILVWDGGMYPRLYFYNPKLNKIENLGELFYLGVNTYSIFSQHFGPFKINENVIKDELSIAGKVMAYTSVGDYRAEIFEDMMNAYIDTYEEATDVTMIPSYPFIFTNRFKQIIQNKNYDEDDIISTIHKFLEHLLLENLAYKLNRSKISCDNFCFGGGAALNIKWNSSIRNSGLFKNVWVCPFPNDSGSAIGVACCELINRRDEKSINWSVYSGPQIKEDIPVNGWKQRGSSIADLADLLHETQEPVIVLNGRAELGPRALGNRSILASPQSYSMKDLLNQVKYRESFRPIAPICIEEKANIYFNPGSSDPFMLFDHVIHDKWLDKIPAVSHLDNSARLQTVSIDSNKFLYTLLVHYENISSIPILCNTSANYKGCGFFPNVSSATKWNKLNYVWCNGILYEKIDKIRFRK